MDGWWMYVNTITLERKLRSCSGFHFYRTLFSREEPYWFWAGSARPFRYPPYNDPSKFELSLKKVFSWTIFWKFFIPESFHYVPDMIVESFSWIGSALPVTAIQRSFENRFLTEESFNDKINFEMMRNPSRKSENSWQGPFWKFLKPLKYLNLFLMKKMCFITESYFAYLFLLYHWPKCIPSWKPRSGDDGCEWPEARTG